MAGEDDEMFMTRSLNVTPKTTEQHLIARSDKSVAYVSNHLALPLNWDLPPPPPIFGILMHLPYLQLLFTYCHLSCRILSAGEILWY